MAKMASMILAFFYLFDLQAQKHPAIEFISYPDFPDANSTWGSIGYNPADSSVYIGVTNHKDKIGLYTYHTNLHTIRLNGFVGNLAHLRPWQWQGKVHSKIVGGPDGSVYFSTDGGESREEYLMDHPKGYAGGYIMKWSPSTKSLTNIGNVLPFESIKDVDVDPFSGKVYAITYPMVHFIVYDPKSDSIRDMGRLGSAHVPRVIFTDKWGNCYYVDWRQRLVKYETTSGKLVFARESLPSFPGTPGEHIITGVTAYAKDTVKNIIYLITYGAKVIAFHPQQNGIGKFEDLGGVYDGNKQPWAYYVPNLNFYGGRLYYIIGGHGNFAIKDRTVLMEFDPVTRTKKQLMEFAIDEIGEVTGSDVRDHQGYLYFAGRKILPFNPSSGDIDRKLDEGISVPFMIRFNPAKVSK